MPTYDFGLNQTINQCAFSALDIQRKLETLDPNKGAGPGCTPPAVFKYCAAVLVPHLTVYFRGLLSVGTFPSVLKQSYVVPIFKCGSKNDLRNYRLIAIQSHWPRFTKVSFLIVPWLSSGSLIRHKFTFLSRIHNVCIRGFLAG